MKKILLVVITLFLLTGISSAENEWVQPDNTASVSVDPMKYKYVMITPEGIYMSNAPIDQISYRISDSGAFRMVFEGEYQKDSGWLEKRK